MSLHMFLHTFSNEFKDAVDLESFLNDNLPPQMNYNFKHETRFVFIEALKHYTLKY